MKPDTTDTLSLVTPLPLPFRSALRQAAADTMDAPAGWGEGAPPLQAEAWLAFGARLFHAERYLLATRSIQLAVRLLGVRGPTP